MPFLKKHFRLRVTLNGRKQDYTKHISIQLTPQERKKQKVRGPPTLVERIYALSTAQHVRCVTHWVPGDSLTRLENLIAKYVKQQHTCY